MSEPLRLAPLDLFIDPLLSFQDGRLREMLAYWESKRAGRAFPARADVSPADIVSHLPSLFLVDVAPPALGLADFRVRLMGTALNDLFARDFTGRSLESELSSRSGAAVGKRFWHCLPVAPSAPASRHGRFREDKSRDGGRGRAHAAHHGQRLCRYGDG